MSEFFEILDHYGLPLAELVAIVVMTWKLGNRLARWIHHVGERLLAAHIQLLESLQSSNAANSRTLRRMARSQTQMVATLKSVAGTQEQLASGLASNGKHDPPKGGAR